MVLAGLLLAGSDNEIDIGCRTRRFERVVEVEVGEEIRVGGLTVRATYAEYAGSRRPFGNPVRDEGARAGLPGPRLAARLLCGRHGPLRGYGRARAGPRRRARANLRLGSFGRRWTPRSPPGRRGPAAAPATPRGADPLGNVLPAQAWSLSSGLSHGADRGLPVVRRKACAVCRATRAPPRR